MSGPLLALAAGIAALIALRSRLPMSAGSGAHTRRFGLALLGFITLTSIHRLTGTPSSDAVLAGIGGGILLLVAVSTLVQGSSDAPAGRSADRARFFWIPLCAYLALIPWSSTQRPPNGDEPWYLLTTHSIAYDLDFDLSNNYQQEDSRQFMDRAIEAQPEDPVGKNGEMYSRHSPMLASLLAAPYRLGGLPGAQIAMSLLSAWLAFAFHRLACSHFPTMSRECAQATAILALAPPVLFFSHQIWSEVPAALCAVLALLAIERLRAGGHQGWALWLWLTLPLMTLLLLKQRFSIVAAGLLLLAAVELPRHRGKLLAVLTIGVAATFGLLLFNRATGGSALGLHSWQDLLIFRRAPAQLAQGSLGPFFDVAFGLFFCAPIWLLLIPGLPKLGPRPMRSVLIVCLPYLLLLASRQEWYGGFSPAFRYGVVLLPVLALGLIPTLALRQRAGSRPLLAVLLATATVVTLLQIAVPGWAYNLANGRTLLLDHTSEVLQLDAARFFPSFTRPRLATWVWPLILSLAMLLIWGRGRDRQAPAAGSWGTIALLTLVGLLPAVLSTLPTNSIEAESPHVWKSGGHPEPERWIPDRTRFPESWVLREFEILEAPIRPGGSRLEVQARLRFISNYAGTLRLRLLDRESGSELAEHTLTEHDVWQDVTLGPIDWEGSRTLRLEVVPSDEGGPDGVLNGLVLDHLELSWSGP